MDSDPAGDAPRTDFAPQTDLSQTVQIACDYVRDALDDLEKAADVLDVEGAKKSKISAAAQESQMDVEDVARQLLLVVADRLESTSEKLDVTAETLQDTAQSVRDNLNANS